MYSFSPVRQDKRCIRNYFRIAIFPGQKFMAGNYFPKNAHDFSLRAKFCRVSFCKKKCWVKKQIAVTTSAFCFLVHNFAHCCNATFLKSPRQVLLVINDLGFFKNRFSQKNALKLKISLADLLFSIFSWTWASIKCKFLISFRP